MSTAQINLFTIYICTTFALVLFSNCKGVKNRNNAYDKVNVQEDEKEYSFSQNFTSKYNILHNARLILQNEQEAIFSSSSKNYQIRQTVFDEPTAEGDAHQMMDSLINKVYKIVNKKQESKYVNEAYFILGKANYLKGAYHTSVEFFNQLLRSAEEQKEYMPLAYAWKSRALLQIGKTDMAKTMIDSAYITLDEDKATRTFVNAARANYLIRTGEEQNAIPYIEYALESNKNRLDKTRWQFLLAQLYKEHGQTDKALHYFSNISKGNVPFDMAFEASLQSSFLKGEKYSHVDQQVKPLLRMLREGKNEGYQDQILFQVGEVYFQKEQPEQAIAYYKRSLAQPARNNYQATETYLKLGDYYFDQKDYLKSQFYYDSAAMILPPDYTDVNKVRKKLGYMAEITSLFHDIAHKDTLLNLAALNEQGLDSAIGKFASAELEIEKKRLAQEAAQASKKRKNRNNPAFSSSTTAFQLLDQQELVSGSGTDRTFYFNNPDERVLGQSTFKRRWGNRQLKDNWRYEADLSVNLSQHTASAPVQDTVEKKTEALDEEAFVQTVKNRYLDAVPKDKPAFDSMHKDIHDNLIVIGNIYRDNAQDNLEAIHVYEEFLQRYPNTQEGPAIYYSLYRMYDDIDKRKSNEYKERLIALFPNSLHAKVAQDPAYMDKYRRDKNILDRLFDRLFDLYAKGDHTAVIAEADRELQGRFENSGLVAQVEYLRALAVGRVGRVEDFTQALSTIIQKHPTDSLVTPLAKENIAFIEQNPQMFINRVNALQDIDKSRVAFVDEPNMTAWPLLHIEGDYRTSVALAVEKPKPIEEPIVPKVAEIKKEVKEEVVETVEVAKVEEKKAVEEVVKVQEKTEEKEDKKEVVEVAEIKKEVEEKTETVAVTKVEEKKEAEVKEPEKPVAAVVEEQKVKEKELEALQVTSTNIALQNELTTEASLRPNTRNVGAASIDIGPNDYRDKKLFPDTAEYYFTINVLDVKVNLAPSRYGIGQFNRTRYQGATINHQLKVVNGENQLVFVGPFKTFEDVRAYEARILPMMPDIMKVPSDIYNTFIITKESIPSLTDGITIRHYHQNYIEQ